MKYLNLGCGARFHSDWINLDIAASGPGVIAHDLRKGIPLQDQECDAVYSSAMLEHIRREDVPHLLAECWRVLKPGGVIRVGVPDSEALCRLYLEKLEAACAGDQSAGHDHEWLVVEMCDQFVREKSGGFMADYLRREQLPNEEFILSRIGEEGRELLKILRVPAASAKGATERRSSVSIKCVVLWRKLWRRARALVRRILLGKEGVKALEIGQFRLKGEVHHWMYDRYSMAQLLRASRFVDPVVKSAASSQITGWDAYHLDILPDGTAVKPDLIFMEARKPENRVYDE